MGARIPRIIRQEILRRWLQGMPRDENAKINHVSNGTVTNVIKEATVYDPQLLLLREVAVLFRSEDVQITEIAHSLRIHRVLHHIGLNDEEKVESFLENLDIYCFKSGLKDVEFIDKINQISCLLRNLEIDLDHLPSYIGHKIKEINDLQLKQTIVLKKYDATMEALEQYMTDKPSVDKIHVLENQLNNVTNERNSLQQRISKMETDNFLLETAYGVPEYELDLVNRKLDKPIHAEELLDISKEIFEKPSKHIEALKLIREQHQCEKNTSEKNPS
ncbi:MAG TPA: hypothetical protein VJ729_14050 [Nitrososphaeraceae archaeon]|nr:hypothetical protein [Nitrososphaeraceae archaeon]